MIKKKACDIINRIRKEEITPIPKWQCRLVDWSFWLAMAVAVFLSSIFFSFLLMGIFEIPIEIFRELRLGHYMKIVLQLIPYIWLLLVILSLFLGLVAFHKTRYGYRYQFVVVVSIAMTLILMLGFFFRQNQIGRPIKELAENRMPRPFRIGPFNKNENAILVEEGLLGGEIIKIKEERLYLMNLFNEKWEVFVSSDTKIKSSTGLSIGDKIIVIGRKEGELIFKAFSIKEIDSRLNHPNFLKRIHQ